MSEPKPIYRTDGAWMATLYEGNLFDPQGEWVAWLDGKDVYSLDGEYVGFISEDGRLLRDRVLSYVKRRRPPMERPPFKPLKIVPLPPMFAELDYSTIDVFEENPEIFDVVGDLRADAGEKPIQRLVDLDPRLALKHRLRKVEQDVLEQMVYGIIYSYRVTEPPVPIEAMAAGRQPEAVRTIETAAPQERQRLAEALVERLGQSAWAVERGYCGPEGFTRTQVEFAARALLMPRHWVLGISIETRQPTELAQRYHVSEAVATLRLHDLE
jgi:hypothetical protein